MILNELWNNLNELRETVPYKIVDVTVVENMWRAYFFTDAGIEYQCRARSPDDRHWNFVFSSIDPDPNNSVHQYNATGSGDAIRVMVTVVAAMKQFINTVRPDSVEFSAEPLEQGRDRMYQTMCSQVAKHIPDYKCTDHGVADGLHKFVIQPTAPLPYPLTTPKYYGGTNGKWTWSTTFTSVNKNRYSCRATDDGSDNSVWHFEFALISRDGAGGPREYGMTGTGDAAKIIQTVIVAFKQFVAEVNPNYVEFASRRLEDSRTRLYTRLCGMLSKHIKGYSCSRDSDIATSFTVVRDQLITEQQLTELRATEPYELTNKQASDFDWTVDFTTADNYQYQCVSEKIGKDTWDFDFALFAGEKRQYGMTGTGDADKVMATVIVAFKQFIAEVKPYKVKFASSWSEESRIRLYTRLCGMISKHIPGYSCSQDIDRSGRKIPSYTVVRAHQITEAHYIGRYTDWGWIRPDGKIFHGDDYPDYKHHESMIQGLLGMDISQAQNLGWVSFQVETNPIFETGKLSMPVATAIKDICDLNFNADWFKVIIKSGRDPLSLLGPSPDRLMLKMSSHMRVSALAESAESHTDAGELLTRFLKFAVQQLKLPALPSIKFRKSLQSHRTDHQTFGYFDPNTDEIHVAVGGRHIMDTLRTLAHELVHHSQRLRGDVNHHSGDTGSSEENEANARAGSLMRDFADAEPQGFNVVKENDAEHAEALKQTGFWGRQAAGCVFVAKDTGRFCIAHRSAAVQEPGTWGTIGGAIDESEDPAEAVRREVAEETGYTGDMQLIPLMVFRAPTGSFKYHNFLAVVSTEFTPDLNWETQAYAWFKFGEWPSPLHPGLKSLLADSASNEIMRRFK